MPSKTQGTAVEPSLRLFFALWPDADARAALNQAGKRLYKTWGGRRMRSDTLHLTLAFLGDTPASRLEELHSLAGSISAEKFTLNLDQPGCWSHNKVGWLGPSETPPALVKLVMRLEVTLEAGHFHFDKRPHVPHVTLLRNAFCTPPPLCQPVVWQVERFALVASRSAQTGAYYEVIGDWPMRGNIDV